MNPPPAAGPLFIVMNEGSGRTDPGERREVIAAVTARHGRQYQLMSFDRRKPIAGVAAEAVRQASACDGVVVAAGGDGTINAVVQAAIGSGCGFGVLPQGTFNYFARTHGIPEDTEAALERVLSGRPEPVQVGRVNDKVFIVNVSLGLYPELLEDRESFKQRFGRSRVVAMFSAMFSLLREHRQLNLQVDWREPGTDDDKEGAPPQRLRTPTLFVGNNRLQLEQIGIDEAEQLQHGRLVAIAPRDVDTLSMFGLALRGAIGQLGDAESVRRLAFRRLRVEPIGRFGRRRYKVATDGEIAWMKPPFDFSVHPQRLWLIKGEPEPSAR
ncbi:diacylglycerol/lipid kinase family protein [Piscinibacter sakaiensis]|uniref:diacylglycerol/lipid kinase family protein n=1 Tax=Piscinibacter sakaiensis TaxID=1547922 RepID=UPI003AAE5CFF